MNIPRITSSMSESLTPCNPIAKVLVLITQSQPLLSSIFSHSSIALPRRTIVTSVGRELRAQVCIYQCLVKRRSMSIHQKIREQAHREGFKHILRGIAFSNLKFWINSYALLPWTRWPRMKSRHDSAYRPGLLQKRFSRVKISLCLLVMTWWK